MGVDNLLHYGKIRWLHGSDKESGSATIRNNFITGKGKRENESDSTLFSMLKSLLSFRILFLPLSCCRSICERSWEKFEFIRNRFILSYH